MTSLRDTAPLPKHTAKLEKPTTKALPCAKCDPWQKLKDDRPDDVAWPFAVCFPCLAHGKSWIFAVCPVLGTRQRLNFAVRFFCRVLYWWAHGNKPPLTCVNLFAVCYLFGTQEIVSLPCAQTFAVCSFCGTRQTGSLPPCAGFMAHGKRLGTWQMCRFL